MGLAARVAGYDRLRRSGASVPAPMSPAGDTWGTRKVEIYVNSQWVDITSLVYYRDFITITRGRSDEAGQTERSVCRLTLNNRSGDFSPRNPLGQWYGQIGRNTPLRVSVVYGDVRWYRFHGEVPAWPVNWDQSGTDVWVPIEAAGVLRRLGQGSSPLNSPLRRGITHLSTPAVAYWPCEDAEGSTSIASAVSGAPAMTYSVATPTFGTDTQFVGSDALPTVNASTWTGVVPSYTSTGDIQLRFVLAVPSTGATNGASIASISTSGTASTWALVYGTGGTFTLSSYDTQGASLLSTGPVAGFGVDGGLLRVSIELSENATSGVDWNMLTLAVGATVGQQYSGTLASQTIGRATKVQIAPDTALTLTDTVIGQISVQSEITSLFALDDELAAFNGEQAGDRVLRLAREEGLNFAHRGSSSPQMGTQGLKTLLELIQECVDVDQGHLYEPRDQVGLGYRDRTDTYGQAARLTLDYAQNQLALPSVPVDDDQATRNDITVSRSGGSSARAVDSTSALSVLPPPLGVGRYDEQVSLNLYDDDQPAQHAGWRLFLGTVDEPRYPSIDINLRHSTFTATNDAVMNLCTNPSLEVQLSPWAARGTGVSVARVSSWSNSGAYSLQVTMGAAVSDTTWGGVHGTTTADYFAVNVGDQVSARAVFYGNVGATYTLVWLWRTAAGTFISQANSGGSAGTGAAMDVTGTKTAPATAVYLQLSVHSDTALDVFYADNIMVQIASTVDDYFDGSYPYCMWAGTADAAASVKPANLGQIRTAAAMTLDAGDRATIVNPPAWLPPDAIELNVLGYSERIGALEHEMSINCSPGSPYLVGYLDDTTYGRVDTDGSELTSAATASATSLSVTVTSGALWTTDAAECPFDVRCGGEVMRVTAVTGSSSPQTFTVTRGVNGITKALTAGTDLRLATPAYVSL